MLAQQQSRWPVTCVVCHQPVGAPRAQPLFTARRFYGFPKHGMRIRSQQQDSHSTPPEVPDFVKGGRKPLKQVQDDQQTHSSPRHLLSRTLNQLLYNYYNYRQDSISDLQLIMMLNVSVIALGALIKVLVVDPAAGASGSSNYFLALYQTVLLTFGQEFPTSGSSIWVQQVFSVLVAAASLAGFAIVLALVEQAVLEVIENNVNQGSTVFEKDHVLVLGWCSAQRDMETISKLVDQLCLAHRSAGGTTIVVLTCKNKLEMEAAFRVLLPERFRFNSKLVFRQGNPLLPEDLHMVAAQHAASTIIVSDTSCWPEAADAQALRAAIFLDELHERPTTGPQSAHVVVEMQTANSLPLVKYACSSAVTAVSTNNYNAVRLAKMIKRPVLSMVLQRMFNFEHRSSLYVAHYAEVEGMALGDAAYMFPDAIIIGIMDTTNHTVTLNPPPEHRLGPTDDLCLLRPTSISAADYHPVPSLMPASCNTNWSSPGTTTPSLRPAYISNDATWPTSWYDDAAQDGCVAQDDVPPVGPLSSLDLPPGVGISGQTALLYLVPGEYIYSDDSSSTVLVCGWGTNSFMADLLRELDHGLRCLAPGSQVLLCNQHSPGASLKAITADLGLSNISIKHVRANPLKRQELRQVDMGKLQCAIVLCDSKWAGHSEDVLRQDALVMTVQLNIRKLREEQRLRPINIICQKLGTSGLTRFEDRHRLPLGMTVNFTSYAAKILAQAAYDPHAMLVLRRLGHTADITVVDAAHYSGCNESVSFWELVSRAQRSSEVLLGYYLLPSGMDDPVEVVLNPVGEELRSKPRVWFGSGRRLKFIILRNMARPAPRSQPTEEEIMKGTQPATWITLRESVSNSGSGGSYDTATGQHAVGK